MPAYTIFLHSFLDVYVPLCKLLWVKMSPKFWNTLTACLWAWNALQINLPCLCWLGTMGDKASKEHLLNKRCVEQLQYTFFEDDYIRVSCNRHSTVDNNDNKTHVNINTNGILLMFVTCEKCTILFLKYLDTQSKWNIMTTVIHISVFNVPDICHVIVMPPLWHHNVDPLKCNKVLPWD